jgi:hypothetical protein
MMPSFHERGRGLECTAALRIMGDVKINMRADLYHELGVFAGEGSRYSRISQLRLHAILSQIPSMNIVRR